MNIKYFILITGLSASVLSQAYTINLKNETPEHIKVQIEYAGAPVFCTNDDIRLVPGQYHTMSVGGCCTSKVLINGVSYPFPTTDLIDWGAGRNWGCRGYTLVIKKDASGKIRVESI